MAYVITRSCEGVCDTGCVDVCPCDCIVGPVALEELRRHDKGGAQAPIRRRPDVHRPRRLHRLRSVRPRVPRGRDRARHRGRTRRHGAKPEVLLGRTNPDIGLNDEARHTLVDRVPSPIGRRAGAIPERGERPDPWRRRLGLDRRRTMCFRRREPRNPRGAFDGHDLVRSRPRRERRGVRHR